LELLRFQFWFSKPAIPSIIAANPIATTLQLKQFSIAATVTVIAYFLAFPIIVIIWILIIIAIATFLDGIAKQEQ